MEEDYNNPVKDIKIRLSNNSTNSDLSPPIKELVQCAEKICRLKKNKIRKTRLQFNSVRESSKIPRRKGNHQQYLRE